MLCVLDCIQLLPILLVKRHRVKDGAASSPMLDVGDQFPAAPPVQGYRGGFSDVHPLAKRVWILGRARRAIASSESLPWAISSGLIAGGRRSYVWSPHPQQGECRNACEIGMSRCTVG